MVWWCCCLFGLEWWLLDRKREVFYSSFPFFQFLSFVVCNAALSSIGSAFEGHAEMFPVLISLLLFVRWFQCSQLCETKYGQWHWKLWPIWPTIFSNMATIWPRFQWILTLISVFIAFLCDNFCKNFKLKKKFYKIFLEKFPQRFNGLAESSKSWGQKWYEGGKMKAFKTKSKLCKFGLKKLKNIKKLVRKLLLKPNMATFSYFTK